MRPIILTLLVLVAITTATAAGIIPQAPVDGATVDPAKTTFSFQIDSATDVDRCEIVIDGAVKKTYTYGRPLNWQSVQGVLAIDEGAHTWYARCALANGTTLVTANRTLTATTPEDTGVRTEASGTIRSSFIHIFEVPTDGVLIPAVRQGDFIGIERGDDLDEWFIKGKRYADGKTGLLLEKKGEQVMLFEDTATRIDAHGVGLLLTYGPGTGNALQVRVTPVDAPVDEPQEDTPPAAEETPIEDTPAETPPQDVPDDDVAPPRQETETPEAPQDTTPTPSGWQRFVSWLARIFGT